MSRPSSDQSVGDEPHRRGDRFEPDPTERRADDTLRHRQPDSPDEQVERTVWDEPGLSAELAGPPGPGQLTYRAWLGKRHGETSAARSWSITLLLAAVAGPWAIVGAFWGSGETLFSFLALIIFGPVIEETMKVAAASYVVEKKPFLFRSRFQIVVCALASGFAFAALENGLYLVIYFPDPPEALVIWRWTICVALHMGCSLIAGLGLMRIWKDIWVRRARARLTLGFPYLLTAVVLHGAYNGLVVVLHVFGPRL